MEERRLYEWSYEKPDLDEFYIQHYGVKGMKWGVRKSEYKADTARYQADRVTNAYKKSASRTSDLAQHRKKLAKITKSKYHKTTANLADKSRGAVQKTLGKASDLMERRANYKQAVADRKKQKLDYSVQRGKELYEQGKDPISNKGLAKNYVKRGILTGSVRSLAKIDNASRAALGLKNHKLSSLVGGKKGKIAARGYNIAKTIQGKIDNRDLQNYYESLEYEKRKNKYG